LRRHSRTRHRDQAFPVIAVLMYQDAVGLGELKRPVRVVALRLMPDSVVAVR